MVQFHYFAIVFRSNSSCVFVWKEICQHNSHKSNCVLLIKISTIFWLTVIPFRFFLILLPTQTNELLTFIILQKYTMLVTKRSLGKHKSQKKTPQNKAIDAKAQVKRLTILLADKENQLQQSQRLNRLYLNQINKLQDDNLALCARSQELKAIDQRTSRQFCIENDRIKAQVQQLLNVIRYLQEQNETIRNQNVSFKMEIEQMRTDIQNGRLAKLEKEEVMIQLQKTKLRLMQSEKYWITRCQTLLCQKENQFQRKLASKQSQFFMKIQALQKDLALKQRQTQQKTEEIYKLITHIRSKN